MVAKAKNLIISTVPRFDRQTIGLTEFFDDPCLSTDVWHQTAFIMSSKDEVADFNMM